MHGKCLGYTTLLLSVILCGCASEDPSTPEEKLPLNSGYVTLDVGDRWDWRITQTRTTEILSGGPSPPPVVTTLSGVYEIIGTERVGDATYAVQRRVYGSEANGSTTVYIRYRQDEDGLYTVPVPATQPPQTSAAFIEAHAGESEGERVELRYPLETDATWTVSAQEKATVEGPEILLLPIRRLSTWRIRIERVFEGPEDYVRVWYTPCGLVRTESHLEILAMDPGTGETVKLTNHVVGELIAFTPAGDASCD